MNPTRIRIPQPDDWHVHLRDADVLNAVIMDTAKTFARAIVMPNLKPPVVTAAAGAAYRARIAAAIPPGIDFTPLMTCYLTDRTDSTDLGAGFRDGIFVAAKLYPAGATTNADLGVTDLARIDDVLDVMQAIGMPLLIHGETTDPDVDVFDREATFIERILLPLVDRHPRLKLVLEHVTTRDGIDFVKSQPSNIAATLTPHHLMINRNAMFRGGLRPHYYCLPVAKREHHRLALRAAVTSGDPKFFLGTDSAPHLIIDKESECGCAGVYNAASALACYAQVFDEENCLNKLAGFASHFGADFYGLPRNTKIIELSKRTTTTTVVPITVGVEEIKPFEPDTPLFWEISRAPSEQA